MRSLWACLAAALVVACGARTGLFEANGSSLSRAGTGGMTAVSGAANGAAGATSTVQAAGSAGIEAAGGRNSSSGGVSGGVTGGAGNSAGGTLATGGGSSGAAGVAGSTFAGAAGAPNCSSLSCATPLAAECVDTKTLRRYDPGTCLAGSCAYSSTDSACLVGCKDGACVPFAVSISAGASSTCATINGGPLKCWGSNWGGLIGDPKLSYTDPAPVPGLESGVHQVSVGTTDACALTDAGGVKCWGHYIGVVEITKFGSDLSAVACGSPYFDHTCVLNKSGAPGCWGANNFGQLGNGAMTESFTYQYDIVGVVGLSSGVLSVSAGSNNTCAVSTGGALSCWGMNWYGALGNGSLDSSSVPVPVSGLSSGVVAVSTGELHACAITTTGALKCWGVGVGDQPETHVPVDIEGFSSGTRAVSVGTSTCAITSAGGLKCWGSNGAGQLGDGTLTTSTRPVAVVGLATGVVAVSVGEYHSCAVTETGSVKCWGSGYGDELGIGQGKFSQVPVDVIGF